MGKKIKSNQNKAADVETKPIRFSLTVKDRLAFTSILPREGDILNQVLSRDIENKVRLTQTEIKKVGLKSSPTGGVTWNPKADSGTEIEFTFTETTLLRSQVEKLDKEKKITPDILSLCLKIRDVGK